MWIFVITGIHIRPAKPAGRQWVAKNLDQLMLGISLRDFTL